LTTDIETALPDRLAPGASANAIACLDDFHVDALPYEPPRSTKPRQPSPYDDYISPYNRHPTVVIYGLGDVLNSDDFRRPPGPHGNADGLQEGVGPEQKESEILLTETLQELLDSDDSGFAAGFAAAVSC
jgi:hypothetical protein